MTRDKRAVLSLHTMCSEMARAYRLGSRALARERTRAAILAAARRELARAGYRRIRVGDIARRARVSRRTVYAHFRGLAALANAALSEPVDALRERVARWRPRSSDAEAVLDEIVSFHARTYHEEHALLETLMDTTTGESARLLLRELDAERLRSISAVLQALAANGRLRMRPADATALVHAALAYPAWRVALTGPAGRRAPRLIATMLKAALL